MCKNNNNTRGRVRTLEVRTIVSDPSPPVRSHYFLLPKNAQLLSERRTSRHTRQSPKNTRYGEYFQGWGTADEREMMGCAGGWLVWVRTCRAHRWHVFFCCCCCFFQPFWRCCFFVFLLFLCCFPSSTGRSEIFGFLSFIQVNLTRSVGILCGCIVRYMYSNLCVRFGSERSSHFRGVFWRGFTRLLLCFT